MEGLSEWRKGTVWFRMSDGRRVKLTNVRHVPGLKKNVISLGMLDSKGCNFLASEEALRVSRGDSGELQGKKIGQLYRLEGSVLPGGATVRRRSNSTGGGQGR